jgi:hypothetical protein
VDFYKKIIFFLINNKLYPVVVRNVLSTPLLFGIRGYYSEGVFEVVSLQRLLKSPFTFSAASVELKGIQWAMTSKEDNFN